MAIVVAFQVGCWVRGSSSCWEDLKRPKKPFSNMVSLNERYIDVCIYMQKDWQLLDGWTGSKSVCDGTYYGGEEEEGEEWGKQALS